MRLTNSELQALRELYEDALNQKLIRELPSKVLKVHDRALVWLGKFIRAGEKNNPPNGLVISARNY